MPLLKLIRPQFFDDNSVEASGYQLFFYEAGTTTKQNTYTDATLVTANPNPIILNARGEPDNSGSPIDIYTIPGASYKVVYATDTDTDPPGSPIWTVDNISDDSVDEYINARTATYVNTTTFTLVGDQTAEYIVGRKLKLTGGADRYTRIATSVFGALTTITAVGIRDSTGLSTTLHVSMDTAYTHIETSNGIRGAVLDAGTGVALGTVDALTITFYPPIVLTDRVTVMVRASGANTITTPTFNPNGAGAKTIVKNGSSALLVGDIAGAGHVLILQYNAGNTEWELLNPAASIAVQATETTPGIGEIATQAETDAETDDERFITPLKLGAWPVTPSAGSVTQTEIANDAVGQAELKTTTASSSLDIVASAGGSIVLTGGTYALWTASAEEGIAYANAYGNGDTAAGTLGFHNTSAATDLFIYVDERYIQASPPYNLGDGDIPLFITVMLDTLSNIIGYSIAPDPIWAYNGPTNIVPTAYVEGVPFQDRIILPHNTRAALNNPTMMAENQAAKSDSNNIVRIEITQAVKNADKNIMPHPFGSVPPGASVIMLDPVSALVEGINDAREAGENIGSLLMDGYISFNNIPVPRGMPAGVKAVTPSWINNP